MRPSRRVGWANMHPSNLCIFEAILLFTFERIRTDVVPTKKTVMAENSSKSGQANKWNKSLILSCARKQQITLPKQPNHETHTFTHTR